MKDASLDTSLQCSVTKHVTAELLGRTVQKDVAHVPNMKPVISEMVTASVVVVRGFIKQIFARKNVKMGRMALSAKIVVECANKRHTVTRSQELAQTAA